MSKEIYVKGKECMDLARIAIVMLLLFICMITDLKEGKINVILCLVGGMLGITLDILEIIGGKEAMDYVVSIIPGIMFILMSRVTAGAVGLGDGIVLITVGLFIDVGHIICLLTVALLLSALIALIIMVFFHRNGKTEIPFIPFLFVGMVCSLV